VSLSGFVVPTSDVAVSSVSIQLFRLHLLVNEPESMQMPREITQNGEQDVDQQVTSTAGHKESPSGWEDDGDEDEDNV